MESDSIGPRVNKYNGSNYKERFVEHLWSDLLDIPHNQVQVVLSKRILDWMPDIYYSEIKELLETTMGIVCKVPITLHPGIDGKRLVTFFRADKTGIDESMRLFYGLLDEHKVRLKVMRYISYD